MSKYLQKGCYHFQEFANPNTTYAKHVDDLLLQIEEHIGGGEDVKGNRIISHEVGCGDGLISDMLAKTLEWDCMGNDTDEIAIGIAQRLCSNFGLRLGSDPWTMGFRCVPDVVLFCDSLEHIKNWRDHLDWAKSVSKESIVIAVPDRHDPHGEQDFKPDFADAILSEWGAPVHRATRHARHLTIWKRHA